MYMNSFQILRRSNQLKSLLKARVNFSSTSAFKEKWDLLSAVCLERRPVVTPALKELEKEYKQLMSEIELEKSLKSNFELQLEADLMHLEKLKKGGDIDDSQVNLKQTAQDFADAWAEERSSFKPADTITDADKNNDLKSLNRKLDKHLVLVLNQNIGDKKYYILPQGVREDGETLRQTAERVLKNCCGSEIKTQIYGNAPCGFYKYKYPNDFRKENGIVGAKIFIYFARYIEGHVPHTSEFKWLDREELQNVLPPQYGTSVRQFLFDE